MISERHVARGFESVWQSCFPMLTPGFMRTFNSHLVKRIDVGQTYASDPVSVRSSSPDVVAELGIELAKRAIEADVPVERIAKNRATLNQSWNCARRVVAKYEGETPDATELPLLENDRHDATILARNLVAFVGLVDGPIFFAPSVPGANVLAQCEADLAVGDTLIEIKTVSRGFRSVDLRQLLVYLALDWTRGPLWKKGCLFNPRRAVWADFHVDWLVRRLSGRPAADTFRDFVDSFPSSVELETTRF